MKLDRKGRMSRKGRRGNVDRELLARLDFKQGRYSIRGSDYLPAAILGTDGANGGAWTPSDVIAGTGLQPGTTICFIGALKEIVPMGLTVVTEFLMTARPADGAAGTLDIEFTEPTFASARDMSFDCLTTGKPFMGSVDLTTDGYATQRISFTPNPGVVGVNRLAGVLSDVGSMCSLNGGPCGEQVQARSTLPLTVGYLVHTLPTHYLRKIDIYRDCVDGHRLQVLSRV
jgi:hypothetical protein